MPCNLVALHVSGVHDTSIHTDILLFIACLSFAVNALSACCTFRPNCASTSDGISVGFCVQKKIPTPFDLINFIFSRFTFDLFISYWLISLSCLFCYFTTSIQNLN